jgi:hypothetical protein
VSKVRITQVHGTIKQVPRGEQPALDLELSRHQSVVNIEMRQAMFGGEHRKTVDWHYTAYISETNPL